MAITRDEVAHFARLSGLDLDEGELDQLTPQLDEIITAMARVQEVPTSGIPPIADVPQLTRALREDLAEQSSADLRPMPAESPAAQQWSGVPPILAED